MAAARKAAGVSQLDAGKHINISRPTYIAIEKGEMRDDINPRVGAWFFVGGYFTMILMSELEAEEFKDPGFISDLMGLFLEK